MKRQLRRDRQCEADATYRGKRRRAHEVQLLKLRARSDDKLEERLIVVARTRDVNPHIQRRQRRQAPQHRTYVRHTHLVDRLARQIERFDGPRIRELRELLINTDVRLELGQGIHREGQRDRLWGDPALEVPAETDVLQSWVGGEESAECVIARLADGEVGRVPEGAEGECVQFGPSCGGDLVEGEEAGGGREAADGDFLEVGAFVKQHVPEALWEFFGGREEVYDEGQGGYGEHDSMDD